MCILSLEFKTVLSDVSAQVSNEPVTSRTRAVDTSSRLGRSSITGILLAAVAAVFKKYTAGCTGTG